MKYIRWKFSCCKSILKISLLFRSFYFAHSHLHTCLCVYWVVITLYLYCIHIPIHTHTVWREKIFLSRVFFNSLLISVFHLTERFCLCRGNKTNVERRVLYQREMNNNRRATSNFYVISVLPLSLLKWVKMGLWKKQNGIWWRKHLKIKDATNFIWNDLNWNFAWNMFFFYFYLGFMFLR